MSQYRNGALNTPAGLLRFSPPVRPVDLIGKKRDGGEHTAAEILCAGRSLHPRRCARLSNVRLDDGGAVARPLRRGNRRADRGHAAFRPSHGPGRPAGAKVDKHSTGGVGDKTSLIPVPVVAAGGLLVPMITGRGLGHTGGTLDKLEAIPGFNVNLSPEEFRRVLLRMMVETGERMGKRVVALITDMDQPLGRMVGNSLEVLECVEILRGERRPMSKDLRELSLELSAWMFYLGRRVPGVPEGKLLAEEMVASGKALAKFREMIRLQGGDTGVLDQTPRLASAKFKSDFKAACAGFVTAIQCEQVGPASLRLGGGRNKMDDLIDPLAGLELHKKTGDAVAAGESIATIYCNDAAKLPEASRILSAAYCIGSKPVTENRSLVKKVIAGSG